MGSDETEPTQIGPTSIRLFVLLAAALCVVDVVVAGALFNLPGWWVLFGDGVVVGALFFANRNLLPATLAAAAASLVVSWSWALVGPGQYGNYGGWPGLAELGGLALLGALCIRYRPPMQAIAASVAIGAAVTAVAGWRVQAWFSNVVGFVLAVAFIAVAAAAWYLRSEDAKRAIEAASTRQAERDGLSRELHDVVGHYVTGIVLQAQAARLVIRDRPDLAAHALAEIESAGADALASMRVMVRSLRSDGETATPLVAPTATIADFHELARATSAGNTPVNLTIDPQAETLPATLVASLHRIALESVTNARRHGIDVTAIDVRLRCDDGNVVLEIANDGSPTHQSQNGGYGLIGIGERIKALEGHLDVGPRENGGWGVRATIPVVAGRR